ncbi:hypohtetical protein [Thermoplasma volcanium GSS1]|uniref:tRNA sulfurtransferase n=1 Tax=Thermoplasma volcanium (strain ATCC 51530 / DSM 4299 / JCM 9571 / NBRC 15438 / GSS1) TaxID=273116 RepID=THII_THEVO|nr:tRNA uracil 4-sulfurtransferase ThiI [Thermoplasma volcanium]Q97AK6.1 RecName: Full=tRNA sulfurtransferase; AltName: Full=Sulfur carrier protein ThiS sulfurtransferase; AltName: Full=Thiamine biosynthesis protein ThiI; AltName: Full=tRNA 4-thiouridine synthase [Thermoplasma volcanium GSS1]BAB59946.1 hypohtetical protein [Thermoplasma volcanium GSS1]
MKTYLVRYSEIGLKGDRERARMERILADNIINYYKKIGYEARCQLLAGRLLVEAENDIPLSKVFGIKSYSECIRIKFENQEDIVKKVHALYEEKVKGKTFGVRCRRTGTHSFTSIDMEKAIGDALYSISNGVDLKSPEVWIHVDIVGKDALIYDKIYKGPGGLPLGSEGKLISMVSGGIDSPVATWLMMKRGSPCDIFFCSLADPIDTQAFLEIAKKLVERWSPYRDGNVFIADCRDLIRDMVIEKKTNFNNVTFKKVLYRLAERLAEKYRYLGIVTGESLGQVSSQTAENLLSIEHGINFPIYRPLIGLDKDEITAIARDIGTFPEKNVGEFCSLFSAHPVTRSKWEDIEEDVKKIDIEKFIERVTAIKFSEIGKIVINSDLMLNKNLEDAVFIDLRKKDLYEKSHYQGARHLDLEQALAINDTSKKYVFYCSMGLQSAYVASVLRERGIEAYFTTFSKLSKQKGSVDETIGKRV